MSILIMLVLGWISYLATRMLVRDARVGTATPTRPSLARPEPSVRASWDALDDRQLTRLLIDAAATKDE
ncbi:MAG: hypothetical protein ABI137_12065 [Antricoccus sp.]